MNYRLTNDCRAERGVSAEWWPLNRCRCLAINPNGTACCSHGREPVVLKTKSPSVPKGRHESQSTHTCRPFGTQKLFFDDSTGSRPWLQPVATPWLKHKQNLDESFPKTLLLRRLTTSERMHPAERARVSTLRYRHASILGLPLRHRLTAGDETSKASWKLSPLLKSIILCAALIGIFQSPEVRAAERPNILFVFADDWGRYASAYGVAEPHGLNSIVQTPNFDRVAASGVLFTRAFVNSPSCTPCRSSLLSGQYFWRTGRGAILQGAIWDASIPAFPLLLQDSGYRIGHSAKVWSPGTPANAPIGAVKTAFNKHGNQFNSFSRHVFSAEDPDRKQQELLDEVRGNFQDFLKTRTADEPFLYWWGPTNTHRTWIQGSGKKRWGIDPELLAGKLPKWLPDVPVVREDVADYLGEVQAVDAGLGVLLHELETTGQLANTLIIVSGDHGMPGVPHGKCNLYDSGAAVSLAVSWPDRIPVGRVVDDFVSLPDLAPTLLDAGGVAIPDVMTARSLMPVLKATGSGQIDATRDHVIIGRERHVAKARTDFLPYPQRAIRTAEFLYVWNFKPDRWPMGVAPGFGLPDGPMPSAKVLDATTFAAFGDMDASPTKTWLLTEGLSDPQYRRFIDMQFALRPEEELYDMQQDPDQIHNVASQPEFAAARKTLSDRLLTILKDSNDPRVTGDGSTFDSPPYSDPAK